MTWVKCIGSELSEICPFADAPGLTIPGRLMVPGLSCASRTGSCQIRIGWHETPTSTPASPTGSWPSSRQVSGPGPNSHRLRAIRQPHWPTGSQAGKPTSAALAQIQPRNMEAVIDCPIKPNGVTTGREGGKQTFAAVANPQLGFRKMVIQRAKIRWFFCAADV